MKINTTNFHPTGTNLLLAEIPENDMTPGGLYIPTQYRQAMSMGIVVELGGEVPFRHTKIVGEQPKNPDGYCVGDTVVFSMHTQHSIQFNRSEKYFVVDIANVVLNDWGYSEAQPKEDKAEPAKEPKRKPIGMMRCEWCNKSIADCECGK